MVLALKEIFGIFQLAYDHPYLVQSQHLHGLQCSVAASANSLFILYISWECLLFVLFVL
jgi:hypothetical protein